MEALPPRAHLDSAQGAPDSRPASRQHPGLLNLHVRDTGVAAVVCLMRLDFGSILLQTILLLILSPLLSGIIKNWKARLQNRRGPRIWQPYLDVVKFLRKDMVVSEHASWI